MSHNREEIIINAIAPALQNSEVRDHFTLSQCERVDRILNGARPCSDEDFRYLLRRLAQAYCQDD